MYTREKIIEEIKRIAVLKGVQNLSQADFELHSMVPMSTVRYYLGTWQGALQEAGLGQLVADTLTKATPETEDELLMDLLRLNKETGEIPTPALIETRGKYYPRHYLERWKSISEAFLHAQKKFPPPPLTMPQRLDSFPSAPLMEPAEIFFQQKETPVPKSAPQTQPEEFGESLRFMTEPLSTVAEASIESLEMLDHHIFEEKPFFFRGLHNPPHNKIGVVYLFATIHRELGYSIHTFLPGSPDCQGERCVDRPNSRWEPINIHFEYKSSDFSVNASSSPGMKDVFVCWLQDQTTGSQDVLELRSVIQQLPSR